MVELKPKAQKKTTTKKESIASKYIEAIGGRKRASARVRISEDTKQGDRTFIVNNRTIDDYFSSETTRVIVRDALGKVKAAGRFNVSVHVSGGGERAQAEALRHGIARALIGFNEEWRKRLKKSGYLKRDPRKKERKKFGLKKARKAPQWSKR